MKRRIDNLLSFKDEDIADFNHSHKNSHRYEAFYVSAHSF